MDRGKNSFLRLRIDRLARLVAGEGHVIEQAVMERVMNSRAELNGTVMRQWQEAKMREGVPLEQIVHVRRGGREFPWSK